MEIEKINCKEHGISNFIEFKIPSIAFKKVVCFQCWSEKVTEGLYNFSDNEIIKENLVSEK